MTAIPRYQHSFDLLLTSQTFLLLRNKQRYCHRCYSQFQLQLRNFSSSPKRRESIPFTEKLRRRIWNTDKPAGRIDPYSPTSPFREDIENLDAIEEGYRNSKEAAGRRDDEEDILSESRSSTGGDGGDGRNIRAMRKQMPTDDDVYVPAETMEGLEWLGLPRWKVRRRKIYEEKLKTMPEWGVPLPEIESQKFTWAKPEEHSSPEALMKALHRGLVEVFTFLSAGQDPLNAVTSQGKTSADWTVAVRIDPSEDKSHAVLTFPGADVRDRILRIRNPEIDKEMDKDDTLQAQAQPQPQSHGSVAAAPVEAAEEILEESEETVTQAAVTPATAASEEAVVSSEATESESETETDTLSENATSTAKGLEDSVDGDVNADAVNQLTGQTTISSPPPPQQQQQKSVIQEVAWGKDWKSISIQDPLIKFALIKRLIQITGLRIMDQHIRQCDTANDLYNSMKEMIKASSASSVSNASNATKTKAKPSKLATFLLHDKSKKAELAELPHVTVAERRITRLDRDVRTGRHAIIEKELKRRGLLDLKMESRMGR